MTRDRAANHRNMSFRRPIVFWIGMLAVFLTLIVLLREVLLPFVTGMVLAYLLNPLAQNIERRGAPRSFECRMDYFCSVRFRIFVRVRRALDCSAACCRDRRAHALRTATVL
jgi:hypothetical protein